MKNPTLSSLLYFFLILIFTETSFGQYNYSDYTERIIDFHSKIIVDTTSKITVTENIKVKAYNAQIQRGIFRSLPTRRNIQEKSFYVKYKIISIKRDGKKEPYHTVYENNNYVVYIGDEEVYLNPGIYQYEITYETYRQIGYFDDFDELYWNVTGNYWLFPIENATGEIQLPEGAQMIQNACYTGQYSSDTRDCQVQIISPTTIRWNAQNLNSGEGLTVAVAFVKGIVNEPQLPFYMQSENLIWILSGITAILLIFLGILWFRFGIDPRKPIVIPQFNPPANLSPASLGFIENGRYTNNLITASFVNLAIKGMIKISESSKPAFFGLSKITTYSITKIREYAENVSSEEKEILENLNSSLKVDGTYDAKVASMVTSYKEKLTKTNKSLIHKGNNRKKIIVPFIVISMVYWLVLILAYFHLFNIDKFIVGIFLYVGMFVVYILIYAIPTLRYKSLFFWVWPLLPLCGFLLYWKYIDNQIEPFNLAFVFLITNFVILSFFKFFIEKPDPEYLKTVSLIEGFKMYLGAAENQLIQFHNPPKMTPEQFEKMLPYAMVLGVDEIWGKKFEDFLKSTSQEYHNAWYSGGVYGLSNMSNSFGDGLSRSISSASIAPSSSGSGSGGGGFSGGGGGGGGGGGW